MRVGPYELAANLSLLFTEVPLLDRFAAARTAGFGSVECWWPFAAADPDTAAVDEFLHAIDAAGVRLVGMNLYAGDLAGGERGIVSHPDRTAELRASLAIASRVEGATGCRVFNALYGQRRGDLDADVQRRAAISHLREAMARLDGTLLLEPLTVGENGADPLARCADVDEVIGEVRAGTSRTNLALLFDTYHLTNNGEDLGAAIERFGGLIGHVQLADAPGRHEPGTGSVDFAGVLAALAAHGYAGAVAAEYRPSGPTVGSLGWISAL